MTYHGNSAKAKHRNLSNLFNLKDALLFVGFKIEASEINTNADLQTNLADEDRPRIAVCDFFYYVGTCSKLEDANHIVVQ